MVDTSTIDLQRSTHQSPIFEGRHVDHRSSKVNTSISEGRHIDLRRATHRSSKVDTSIFEDRRRKHHTYNSSPNIVHNYAPKSLEWMKLHTLIRYTIDKRAALLSTRLFYLWLYRNRSMHACTSYVLYAYLYCVYGLVGGAISIHDQYILAVSRVCANGSLAVFHRPVVCAVKT